GPVRVSSTASSCSPASSGTSRCPLPASFASARERVTVPCRSGSRLRAVLVFVAAAAVGCNRDHVYTGEGDVLEVDAPHRHVTIRHDDIPGLMPAMTMRFAVRSADTLAGTTAGTRVRFDVVQDGQELVVTRLAPEGAATPR